MTSHPLFNELKGKGCGFVTTTITFSFPLENGYEDEEIDGDDDGGEIRGGGGSVLTV